MAAITQKKLSSTQFRLYVDLVLFATYILVNIPQATLMGIGALFTALGRRLARMRR